MQSASRGGPADIAGQSTRTFYRQFKSVVGTTPLDAVEGVRCELARMLLHTTDLGLKQIARKTGFGTEATLRNAMIRRFGMSPMEMRERF